MTQRCKRDHELTPENTMLVQDSQRGIRKRCKECLNAPRRKNKPTVTEMARMATSYLHEDIEDLLSFGSTYNEILERGGFSSWDTMYRSLKRRERYDLIDQLRAKKDQAFGRTSSSIIPGTPNKKKNQAGSIRFQTYAAKG